MELGIYKMNAKWEFIDMHYVLGLLLCVYINVLKIYLYRIAMLMVVLVWNYWYIKPLF